MVVNACNPSYSEGGSRRISKFQDSQGNLVRLFLKIQKERGEEELGMYLSGRVLMGFNTQYHKNKNMNIRIKMFTPLIT